MMVKDTLVRGVLVLLLLGSGLAWAEPARPTARADSMVNRVVLAESFTATW